MICSISEAIEHWGYLHYNGCWLWTSHSLNIFILKLNIVHLHNFRYRLPYFVCLGDYQDFQIGRIQIKDKFPGMMCKLLSKQPAPNVDIDVLMATQWNFTISCQYLRRWWRSKLLIQGATCWFNCTKGEANELVKYCIQQPTKVCYNNAKNLLMKYVDLHKILLAYRYFWH